MNWGSSVNASPVNLPWSLVCPRDVQSRFRDNLLHHRLIERLWLVQCLRKSSYLLKESKQKLFCVRSKSSGKSINLGE